MPIWIFTSWNHTKYFPNLHSQVLVPPFSTAFFGYGFDPFQFLIAEPSQPFPKTVVVESSEQLNDSSVLPRLHESIMFCLILRGCHFSSPFGESYCAADVSFQNIPGLSCCSCPGCPGYPIALQLLKLKFVRISSRLTDRYTGEF